MTSPLCWWHRLRRTWPREPSSPLPSSSQRHLEACPTCRSAASRERSLADRLRQEASARRQIPPPFLCTRIMASVRRQADLASHSAPRANAWGLRMAVVGVASLAVALFLVRGLPPSTPPAELPSGTVADLVPKPEELVRWGTLLDQPLREEGRLVLQDARNAMNGLATVLLPEGLLLSAAP